MSWKKIQEGSSFSNSDTLNKISESNGRLEFEGNKVEGISSNTSKKKPMIVFILDDTKDIYYNTLDMWTSRGYKFTTGLRLDFVDGISLTFDMLREMQNKGIEIAYHGQDHDGVSSGAVALGTDVENFLAIASTEKLIIDGFIGPGGSYDENTVFHMHFDTFKWARGAGASNGVANVKNPADFFKLIYDSNSFIDDLTTDSALTTLKSKVDSLFTRGTGILTLSMHMHDTTKSGYVDQLLGYIQTKGIDVVSVREAYETYGAILELYDESLQLGSSFDVREDGNGGTTINSASSHFILQKDGTVISNVSAMKMITPIYRNKVINGNTLPNDFPIGVSIIQYGSIDDHAALPNVGTLYNFNLGKNAGQQFQLFKQYGKGGVFYRDSNTDNTWKTGMADHLGIFRQTTPKGINDVGYQGDFSADSSYLYICYADNNWLRVPKDSTWTTTV